MNFSKGILESRKLHYKHLSTILRPISLNTPTEIEVGQDKFVTVTLFDANHCTGAVMFLIEGDGKAILYTGDIRAESWWIDGLIRHPVLIPYTLGTKRLDMVYLDTTFARSSHSFHNFPTKAEGIAELLRKLEPYPKDTIFYFRAWTFGYEGVWVALAAALKSTIHVDEYQIGLYKSVSLAAKEGSGAGEAPSLCGHKLGNRFMPGCLTADKQSRIHSCEPGTVCSAATSSKTVYISPIVSRTGRDDVLELGAGGGLGDLYQVHELELPDQSSLDQLEQLCSEKIKDPDAHLKAKKALSEAFNSRNQALSLGKYGMTDAAGKTLDDLVNALSRSRADVDSLSSVDSRSSTDILDQSGNPLPRTIRFPYSRHSSYTELCKLVAAFRPRDIYPCTVDPKEWDESISMESLFGEFCSGNTFAHDRYMRVMVAEIGEPPRKRARRDPVSSTQSTQQSTVPTYDESVSQISEASIQQITETSQPLLLQQPDPSSPALPSSAPTPTPAPVPQQQPQDTEDTHDGDGNEASQDSLGIPSQSPRSARRRRNTIRDAHRRLQDVQNRQSEDNTVQLQLGPLPDSWPTNEESSQRSATTQTRTGTEEIEEIEEGVSQITTIHDPDPDPDPNPTMTQLPEPEPEPEPHPLSTDTATAGEQEPSPRAFEELLRASNIFMEREMERDVNANLIAGLEANTNTDTYPSANINTDTESNPILTFSQQSAAITVSTSEFASQNQDQSQSQGTFNGLNSQNNEELQYLSSLVHEDHVPEHENDQPPTPRPYLSSRETSIRNRQAAYAAAREDSYDAWAEVGITSAGNNHSVEEKEL
ncbi:putative DNA repair protein [Aspergillus stella-maris]|uniref:putative DNA repair protein n=1 Tax=Aspergillus stella-maris TaxID=1810926 RepID=UPI003CCD5C03